VLAVVALAGILGVLGATACSGSDDTGTGPRPTVDPDAAPLRITTLSGPPAFVTGTTAVVAVDSPAGRSLDDVRVTSGHGTDVVDLTDVFAPDEHRYGPDGAPPRLVAFLDRIPIGESTLTATSGDDSASITLVAHSNVEAALFSGPRQSPFVCASEPIGLGPPGADCSGVNTVTFRYWNTDGELLDLPGSPGELPPDVATTTTSEGEDVPLVVRLERSVDNRSITTTAVLDPSAGASTRTAPGDDGMLLPSPGEPSAGWDARGWNGRLVMRFGGGCGTTYSQGTPAPTVLDRDLLGAGYAVAAGSLTSFRTACNATVAAETAMVVKERFVETYGIPRHTIGEGGSGGALQQLQIAQNYPGILDGLALAAPFPDAVTIAAGAADCGLLERWFDRAGDTGDTGDTGETGLSGDQQRAITGFASSLTCSFWDRTYLETIDPSVGCDPALDDQVWEPVVRPRGVRCTFQDSNVNILGTEPTNGYANRPLDNVGVQYGLQALRDGSITADQFLDLNEGIGGYDIDGAWQPQRTRASDDALARAYRGGMVTAGTASAGAGALGAEGSGGLADVPIIVQTTYTDPIGDIHDRQRAFAIRERLRSPDGTADPNLAIWSVPAGRGLGAIANLLTGGSVEAGSRLVTVIDEWLTAAEDAAASDGFTDGPSAGWLDITGSAGSAGAAGTAGAAGSAGAAALVSGGAPGTWAARLAAARPSEAGDRCELPSGEVVEGDRTYDAGSPCDEAYPLGSDPRRVAGAPLVQDTLACALVEVDPGAYGVELTAAQTARLRSIFLDGVCDWGVAGRQQQAPAGPWQVHDQP
jgi:hypothetical protein